MHIAPIKYWGERIDMLPKVKGLVKNSLLEWEGRLSSVVLLPGCNLRCPGCNVPHLLNANTSESIPFEDVHDFWKRQRSWIEGVVVSGGEPLVHENIDDLLIEIKALGFPVMLVTNGTYPERLEKLIRMRLLDYVAMDVKAPLNPKYSKLCGVEVDTTLVKKSIDVIIDSGVPHEFRTTFVPVLLDAPDVIDIARTLMGADKYVLQQFDPRNCLNRIFRKTRPCSRTTLKGLGRIAGEYVKTVIRGEGYEHMRAVRP